MIARTVSEPPPRFTIWGGLWQRADNVPFASKFLCHWLLLREKWRRKANNLDKDIINFILSRHTERVDLPNVDWWRFPNGLRWNAASRLYQTLQYIHRNSDRLSKASARLADEASRAVFLEVLAFRALGPQHVRMPAVDRSYWNAYEIAKSWIQKREEEYGGYDLYLFSIPFERNVVYLKCWLGNIVYTFLMRQYFFSRDSITIQPEYGDIVLDLGACLGDTALAFAIAVGERGKVYSFDPLPRHKAIFEDNISKNPGLAPRVAFIDKAVSDASDELISFSDGAAGSRVDPGGLLKVKAISVDDFVESEKLLRVDFIKMDIEGAEITALYGCRATIERFCPKLAISIYHRPQDLYEIIEQVHSIDRRYQIYVEQYTAHDEEVILYGHVPEKLYLER